MHSENGVTQMPHFQTFKYQWHKLLFDSNDSTEKANRLEDSA